MKNYRQTYKADRPPTCQKDIRFAGRLNEPMGSDPPKNHPPQLIEYNERMRYEEKRYSRLLTELKKASWFTRHDSTCGGPPDVKCNVGRMLDKLVSSELETTRLTDDEVHNGCWLTMEQELLRHNKPPLLEIDKCSERTSTQQSIAFQYTMSVRGLNISRSPMIEAIQAVDSNLSESSENGALNVNRLWLEIGETYSNFSECDYAAATNSAGPEASRRIGNWYTGSYRHQSVWPIQWDSIMVESVRLVLQRWRGVCSFSQTMRSNRSVEKYQNVYPLCTKKRSRPGE